MKLKIILYEDAEYTKRVEIAFSDFPNEEFELYCFHRKENLLAYFSLHEADVLVASENKKVPEELLEELPVLYLTEHCEVGKNQIFRYQKLEQLLREIERKVKRQSTKTKLLVFTSMQGGCGVTTSAKAASLFLAEHGCKVAYLDFSFPGIKESMFSKEKRNQYGFVEIPVSLGSIGEPIEIERAEQFLDELKESKKWEYLVADFPMYLDLLIETFKNRADHVIYVCVGSREGNQRFMRGADLWNGSAKTWILYNKFDEQSTQEQAEEYEPLGGIVRYAVYDTEKIIEKVADLSIFESFLG